MTRRERFVLLYPLHLARVARHDCDSISNLGIPNCARTSLEHTFDVDNGGVDEKDGVTLGHRKIVDEAGDAGQECMAFQ